MPIQYLTGDATNPSGSGPRIITHICNDIGGWGRGFVLALSARWPQPEARYRAWSRGEETLPFELGEVQFVEVEEKLWVANMIAQRDIKTVNGVPPIRYEALEKCLEKVAAFAREQNASIHMPRIGAGLAGGDWQRISQIIEAELVQQGISVTVYDLPS